MRIRMPSAIVNATIQSCLISSLSNITAQLLQHWRGTTLQPFSLTEFLQFFVLNAIVCPPNFLWQAWLEKHFPAKVVPSRAHADPEKGDVHEKIISREEQFSWRNTFAKWFIDCIALGALVNTVAFLIILGVLKRHSAAEIAEAIRRDTIPIIIAGYKIWPIASIVSFTFIPWERRIVFLSLVGFAWGIYMSIVAAQQ